MFPYNWNLIMFSTTTSSGEKHILKSDDRRYSLPILDTTSGELSLAI